MLELDDIQHFLLLRAPALAARYEFLAFREPAQGRAWLSTMLEKVGSAKDVGQGQPDLRWVTIAFTWNGLRAVGIDDASLATFPEEFKVGMADRADVIGTTGKNNPEHWIGDLTNPDLHAVVILFASDIAERERCTREHQHFLRECGVEVLSSLDLAALPPYDRAHEHFGYRDRLSEPVIEGSGYEPTPGSGRPLKAGEFFLGYPDELGFQPALPEPEILAQRKLHRLHPASGACGRLPRLPPATRRDSRRTGTGRGETHGPLAQRSAVGSQPRQGQPGARRG